MVLGFSLGLNHLENPCDLLSLFPGVLEKNSDTHLVFASFEFNCFKPLEYISSSFLENLPYCQDKLGSYFVSQNACDVG
jgi:hypothetical protein